MELTITRAAPEDAAELLEVFKIIGGETDNLTFGAEGLPLTVEEEQAYLASLCTSTTGAVFLAKRNGKIIGNASFTGLTRPRLRHRGEVGLSVLRAEWGQGVGSKLMETVLAFARDTARAEIVSLEVRSDNARAIALYKKYGFEKIGCFKGFFKLNGDLVDFDLMNLYL